MSGRSAHLRHGGATIRETSLTVIADGSGEIEVPSVTIYTPMRPG